MSYTPPVTYVAGTNVEAADLNTNLDALRKYINKSIVVGDLSADAFSTGEIVKGEYYNIVQDHQFTTGDLYTEGIVSETNSNNQYYSSTIKTRLSSQWGTTNQYQIVADTGKAIFFETNNGLDNASNQAAKIIITGHIGVRNYYQYVFNGDYNSTNQETKFYLMWKIDGVINEWSAIAASKAQVLGFETYMNTNSNIAGTSEPNDRRVIPFLFHFDIPNLVIPQLPNKKSTDIAWRFAIGVESQIDLGWINNRFMTYEVFYA